MPVVAPLDENGYLHRRLRLADRQARVGGAPSLSSPTCSSRGCFYHVEPYTHRYPHVLALRTPLVFRLVDEWFISMDGLRQPLMDVTDQIRWIPAFGHDRELDWLRNMHDWMISKKRYWGLALPIWECEACGHFDVIGSETNSQQRAVEGWETFEGHTPHRPTSMRSRSPARKCGSRAQRIADVGNPWLDAGIVGFRTLRYRHRPGLLARSGTRPT